MKNEPDLLTQLEWLATQLDAPNNCGGSLIREAIQKLRALQGEEVGQKKRSDEGLLGEDSEKRLAEEAEEYEIKKRMKSSKTK